MRLVPVNHLRENTVIAIDVINDESKILLRKGQKITKAGINILERLGISYVYIRDEYCLNNNSDICGMDFNKIQSSVVKLKAIANRVCAGISDRTDMIAVASVAKVIVNDIVMQSDDIKITYEPIKMVVNSVIERGIYVAMMSTALGNKMKLSKKKLEKLCFAALLKDLALVSPKIQSDKNLYYHHPYLAYKYLKEHYDLDEEILNAVLHHHEHCDGSGFPNKLKGNEISELAKIIGIVDMFYEIKSSHDMLHDTQEMFENKLNKIIQMFDTKVLSYFIKETELFTLDTLVRLSNGDVAVIIENNFTNIFRPVVKIIKSNTFLRGEVIHLQNYSKLQIKNLEYYVDDDKQFA